MKMLLLSYLRHLMNKKLAYIFLCVFGSLHGVIEE